jgi:hypothetical protein
VKYSGFNQKPITMGLLKRGLGVISALSGGETTGLSSSLKGDQFHGESKVPKFAAYSLASVSAQKIGKLALFALIQLLFDFSL